MTKKLEGPIVLEDNTPKMPTCETIPAKQEWNHFCIWEFNGKRYRPLTQKAEDNLTDIVKNLEAAGFKGATKPGKRKPASLKYAVTTTGVEDFKYI